MSIISRYVRLTPVRALRVQLKHDIFPINRQQKIRNDVMHDSRRLAAGVSWFGVEPCQFIKRLTQGIFIHIQCRLKLVKVLFRERIVVVGQH